MKMSPYLMSTLVRIVAESFHVKPEEIMGDSREPHIALARRVSMYLASRHGGGIRGTARAFAGRSPSTALRAIAAVESIRGTDERIERRISEIERRAARARVNERILR